MTSFTDEEEDQTEAGRLGMEWLLDVALKNAGAVFDDGPSAWISHVVVDRNLITGQNPGSTEATADAVIKKLRSVRDFARKEWPLRGSPADVSCHGILRSAGG